MQVPQKKRITFSYSQLSALEGLFAKDPSPSTPTKQSLAAQLQISFNCIDRWFYRRRRNLRLQMENTSTTSEL